jgi:hypothetical protein
VVTDRGTVMHATQAVNAHCLSVVLPFMVVSTAVGGSTQATQMGCVGLSMRAPGVPECALSTGSGPVTWA